MFRYDYNTIRDNIHISDLAKGHVKAIENLNDVANVYNQGTKDEPMFLELGNTFNRVNKVNFQFEIVAKRPEDDIGVFYFDLSKVEKN